MLACHGKGARNLPRPHSPKGRKEQEPCQKQTMGIDPSNEGVQSDWTAYHLQGCKRDAGNAKGGHIACMLASGRPALLVPLVLRFTHSRNAGSIGAATGGETMNLYPFTYEEVVDMSERFRRFLPRHAPQWLLSTYLFHREGHLCQACRYNYGGHAVGLALAESTHSETEAESE